MKTPKKTKKLYERLRRDILQRHYVPGEQLPSETEFSAQLGISRDTLRRALSLLEKESLIRRVRGYGTYVSETVVRRKITFLLPCAETITPYSSFLTGMFQGVLEEAHKQNCEVETLTVSPSNQSEDIDWSALFNLNSGSRVVVCGFWFEKIFPFLSASNCRVALIYDTAPILPRTAKWITRWNLLEKRVDSNAKSMTEYLLRQNCRRPAFFLRYLNTQVFLQSAISDCLRKEFPDAEPCFFEIDGTFDSRRFELTCPVIMRQVRAKYFDGILVNDSNTFHFLRKHLPDVPCGYIDLKRQSDPPADKQVFYSDFDLREIGRQAVLRLLDESLRETRQEFFAKIYQCAGLEAPSGTGILRENSERKVL